MSMTETRVRVCHKARKQRQGAFPQPTGGSNPSDIVISVGSLSDAANIRVPISPRGVEYTAKNFVTQVRSQAALKITPTLLGDAKTARLVMDTPGITDSSKYKPKIVTSGVTNTSIKHFLGGFNDEFLGFAGSSARGTFTPETGHHGRTMLTNLVAPTMKAFCEVKNCSGWQKG